MPDITMSELEIEQSTDWIENKGFTPVGFCADDLIFALTVSRGYAKGFGLKAIPFGSVKNWALTEKWYEIARFCRARHYNVPK